MAQTGYTPISLYHSTTPSTAPTAGNLVNGELAINIADKKLYAKDSGGNVFVIADASSGGTTATNIAGGLAGSVPYQSGANTTTFLGIGSANYVLTSSGTAPQWTANTGTGNVVRATSATLVTPILGTPTSGTLTNCTGLPVATGISGLGANVATFLATPSSANLAAAVTDETGSGSLVFGTSPTIATPTITTSATVPLVIGGTGTTSTLTLRSTSGVGTTGADIIFQTGNNGATEAMRILNSGNVGIGSASPAARLQLAGNLTASSWTTSGIGVRVDAATYTDSSTAASGTVATAGIHAIAQPTIAASNASVTYTDAATLYIANAPANGTNVTVTNPYALYVAGGASYFRKYSSGTASGNLVLSVLGNSVYTTVGQWAGISLGTSAQKSAIIALDQYNNYGRVDMVFAVASGGDTNNVTLTDEKARINNAGALILGVGEGSATTSGNTFRAPDAAGTNIAGANLTIAAGNGTGTGGSGYIRFSTAAAGTAGTTANSLTERVRIDKDGNVGIGTAAPGAKLDVAGSIRSSALTSGRVTYATTSGQLTDSGNLTFDGTTLGTVNDASINGLTAGKGGGNLSGNTAFGESAYKQGTIGVGNDAFGYRSLGFGSAAVTGTRNLGIQYATLYTLTSGSYNIAIGAYSQQSNQTGNRNTAVGYESLNATTGSDNVAFGYDAGLSATTGTYNTFIGTAAGRLVTTGAKNTILGAYNGNIDGLDIRTASNYAVIADGDGNRLLSMYNGGTLALDGGAVPQAGTGITFPATQSASSDANTLDDYEEGTWTPTIIGSTAAGTASYTTQYGYYTKIGRVVYFQVYLSWSAGTGTGNLRISGLPFTTAATMYNANAIAYQENLTVPASSYAGVLIAPSATEVQFTSTAVAGGNIAFLAYDAAASVIFSGFYTV